MLVTAYSYAPDDVCVRCKVRNSSCASNLAFGELVEMTCTMRNWQQDTQPVVANRGPELLLCPVNIDATGVSSVPTSSRFHSFGSTPSIHVSHLETPERKKRSHSEGATFSGMEFEKMDNNNKKKGTTINEFIDKAVGGFSLSSSTRSSLSDFQSYAIPVREIVLVTVNVTSSQNRQRMTEYSVIQMTTESHGLFELHFGSKNSYDVLLAFLQSSLLDDRIVSHDENARSALCNREEYAASGKGTLPSFNSSRSVDMENFMAREMSNSLENESAVERIRRNMKRFGDRLSEMVENLHAPECLLCEGSNAIILSPEYSGSFFPSSPISGVGHDSKFDQRFAPKEKRGERNEAQLLTNISYERDNGDARECECLPIDGVYSTPLPEASTTKHRRRRSVASADPGIGNDWQSRHGVANRSNVNFTKRKHISESVNI